MVRWMLSSCTKDGDGIVYVEGYVYGYVKKNKMNYFAMNYLFEVQIGIMSVLSKKLFNMLGPY